MQTDVRMVGYVSSPLNNERLVKGLFPTHPCFFNFFYFFIDKTIRYSDYYKTCNIGKKNTHNNDS